MIKNPVGRPSVADKAKNRTFKLTDAQYLRLKSLGGVKWLKLQLDVKQ